MSLEQSSEKIWKGTNFWTEEIKKAGIFDDLLHFNDVITEKTAPHPESTFHLVKRNIILDGKTCDIYHTDQDEDGRIENSTFHRIYIHIKE